MGKKKFRITSLCILLLFPMSFIIFNNSFNEKIQGQPQIDQYINPTDENHLEFSDYSLTEYSGIGSARNFTEYGEGIFENYNKSITNNENASIIVPYKWNADTINCTISKIYDYDATWINSTFDTGINNRYWTNYTQRSENVSFGWYNAPSGSNDSIYIRFEDANEGGTPWNFVNSYLNYTFYLPREKVPFESWYIDFNYRVITNNMSWLDGKIEHYFTLYVNDRMTSFKQNKLDMLSNNTWYSDNLVPITPEVYNFNLPGTISLLFGIDFKNSNINPTGFFKMFYDNISLKLSTIPQPSQINLNITDHTNNIISIINDTAEYGEGVAVLQNIWKGEIGGKTHNFSFSSNSSGFVIIDSIFHVESSSSKKTTTQIGEFGSEFLVENDTKTTWVTYFPISIPGSYSINYYVNISKPLNWNITQVFNPYNNDKINDTMGAGYGNSSIIIPNNIVLNGVWKIVAKAPNYVKECKIFKKESSIWEENNIFQVFDKMKVNASIDTNLNPNIAITNASLLIFCPNNSICYQEKVKININGFVEFSEITFGYDNATAGEYTVQVIWNNKDNNMTNVGLYILKFEVHRHTVLKRSNFHVSKNIPAFSGDIVLIKVNYSDYFTGEGIEDATINYTVDNETKIEGFMIYQGGGIYSAEVDTTGLQIGIYNVSISASKLYYQSQNNIELFEIEIQLHTTLERYEYPTVVEMKDNATVKFLYKDSYGIGIPGATVKLSINQDYIVSIDYMGDGNYIIIFNTAGFSSLGLKEISFNFSCIGYETKINYLQFEIIEQKVDLKVYIDSMKISENFYINATFRDTINIAVRSFATKEGIYLKDGIVKLIVTRNQEFLTEGPDTWYNTSITISPSIFSLGLNYVYLEFKKENYSPTTFSFQIIVQQIDINVSTIGFKDSIIANPGDEITIQLNLTELGTNNYIENATVSYYWVLGNGYFDYVDNGIYELKLNIPDDLEGNHKISLTISKEGGIYKVKEFSFILSIIAKPQPNILTWIILAGSLIVISILGILSLRSYVFLPRKRRKRSELLVRTQKFKDIMDIQAIVISHRTSGVALYIRSYYSLEKHRKELLSGFIHAITTMSTSIIGEEILEQEERELKKPKSIEKIIQLDFKFFHFLICDYKDIRVVFVLGEKASQRLINRTEDLLISLDLQFSEDLINWDGDLEKFSKFAPSIIKKYFELYYKDFFQLNETKYISKITQKTELSKMEKRVFNVIKAMTKDNKNFYLQEVVETVSEKNKSLIIDGIESLIEKKIIVPSS